jgi:hypothetical protein
MQRSLTRALCQRRAPARGLEPFTITVAAIGASARVVLEDVLFGDIYFITGQSNAQFSVDLGVNVSAELEAANNYPNIRLFTVGIGTLSAVPLDNLQTLLQPWTRASNESVGLGPWAAFSAVGWYFCRDLFNAMSGAVPVGCVGKQVHARTQASPPRVSPLTYFLPLSIRDTATGAGRRSSAGATRRRWTSARAQTATQRPIRQCQTR